MIDIEKIRKDFPMLEGKSMQGKPLVYLDNAATSFKPYSVIKAVTDYYANYTSNSHRGDYDIAHQVDVMVEDTRKKVADFINSKPTEVVFTSGTSMSINMVAFGYGMKFLKSGDEILLTQAEHASNVLPWFKVAEMTGAQINYIPLDEEGRLTPENLAKVISSKTKIVAVAHVTNVLGFVVDIKEIAKIAHAQGAILVCDGAQSVPHMKTNVKDWEVDFLSFSGHKMLGPTGIGVLYGKFSLLEKMDPFMTGGGQTAKFDMCGDVNFLAPPIKFEAGTQNLAGIAGLGAAIDYLTNIGMDNIEEYERNLKRYAVEKLAEADNVIVYNPHSEAGIVTFNIKDVFAQDAASFFNSRGVAVRSGQHCAKILIDFLHVVSTCRASFYFYNTKAEIDAFVEAAKHGGDFLDAYL